MSASVEDQLPLLTEWKKSSSGEGSGPLSLPEELATIITAEMKAELEAAQFSLADIVHLRDCAVARALSRRFDTNTGSDADRVASICNYVSRTICLSQELIDEADKAPARSVFSSLLLGEGTPADRAAAVGALARELKFDAALMLPASNASPKTESTGTDSLVLVVLGKNVFVFDPMLGQLITLRNSPNPWKRTPATLSEILADESLLRQYDAPDRPYAWTASRMKEAYVSPIGNASLWSARMVNLQSQLTADSSLVASDPLGNSSESPGCWSRIRAVLNEMLPTAKPFVWEHPQQQLAAGSLRASVVTPRLESRVNALNLRLTIGEGEQDGKRYARFERSLLRGRLAELSGETSEAIGRYTEVRTTFLVAPPDAGGTIAGGPRVDETQARNYLLEAKDAAEFWTIQCQIENDELPLAATAAEYYLRNRSKTGKWIMPARLLLAESRGRLDKLVSPIRILQGIGETEPQHREAVWLIHNLEAAAKPVEQEPAKTEEQAVSDEGGTEPENAASDSKDGDTAEKDAEQKEQAEEKESEKPAQQEESGEASPANESPEPKAVEPKPEGVTTEPPAGAESTSDAPPP